MSNTRISAFFRSAAALITAAAAILTMTVCAPSADAYTGQDLYDAKGMSSKEIKLSKLIIDTIKNHRRKSVDISKYNVSFSEFEDIYCATVLNEPELFYVSVIKAGVSYNTEDHILTFTPIYKCAGKDEEKMRAGIEKYAEEVLSGVHDSWRDEEKVLYIHDCLASHITYYDGKDPEFGRSIYDAFVNKSSVCVGYALGFQYFMDMLDIPCVSITSDDHIWNQVKIDGQWYHVDVTWDDSAQVTDGFMLHNVILSSEDDLLKPSDGHARPNYTFEADDSFYSDAFWTESNTRISYLGGYWYYTNIKGLYRYSFNSGMSSKVYGMKDVWHADNGRNWTVPFSQTAIKGKSVYFNSSSAIYRYDTSKKKVFKVYEPELEPGYQIYDMYINGSSLVYCAGNSKNPCKIKKSIKLSSK